MSAESVGPISRLVRALFYSMRGLRGALRTEGALRLEIAILAAVIPAAWLLKSMAFERALLISSWMLVIVVELVNSAIETAVDRIGPEHNELSGRAKDIGSAAVFSSIVLAASVWLILLAD
jgi:diacylglycerol kinase (ATP)